MFQCTCTPPEGANESLWLNYTNVRFTNQIWVNNFLARASSCHQLIQLIGQGFLGHHGVFVYPTFGYVWCVGWEKFLTFYGWIWLNFEISSCKCASDTDPKKSKGYNEGGRGTGWGIRLSGFRNIWLCLLLFRLSATAMRVCWRARAATMTSPTSTSCPSSSSSAPSQSGWKVFTYVSVFFVPLCPYVRSTLVNKIELHFFL